MIALVGQAPNQRVLEPNGRRAHQRGGKITHSENPGLRISSFSERRSSAGTFGVHGFSFSKTEKSKLNVVSYRSHDRVNCSDETTATVSYVAYGADENVLSSNTTSTILLQYQPAPPGSLAAAMVRVICKFDAH